MFTYFILEQQSALSDPESQVEKYYLQLFQKLQSLLRGFNFAQKLVKCNIMQRGKKSKQQGHFKIIILMNIKDGYLLLF